MLFNGVRKVFAGGRTGSGIPRGLDERKQTMAVSLRESVQRVSDPRNLDASVEEVFRLMLGIECRREIGRASCRERVY